MTVNINFSQTTGHVTDDSGTIIAHGYAGNNKDPKHLGKNNPELQGMKCVGPLPQGKYTIGKWGDHGEVGPNSAPLTQIEGETFGRNDFLIHGPGGEDPANCSKGCIVIPHDERMKVIALKPDTVTVTA